ncbi:hypothetical protein [Serinibacter arcticus]|uniref:Uncharacterized protein n=1 Tax=Serinibacter arcticus TaxID=1655435 RepID=A0A4Z1E6C0_9MICO|nr:hypothetical protein [Serinibacter arcticus]TGO06242.1 hypothetical protein SERN_0434 [Serinibacter arcticus]
MADDSRHDETSRPTHGTDPAADPAGTEPGAPAAYPPPQQVRGTVSGGAPSSTQHAQQPQQPGQQQLPGVQQLPPARPVQSSRPQRPATPVRRAPTSRPKDAPHRDGDDSGAAADGEAAGGSSRRGLGRFLLLVAAAVLASSLQLPWSVLALVLAVVAVVVGIRMLMSSRGTTRAIWNPLIIASLAMSGFVALTSGAAIVSWPAQMDLQQCRDRALTHGAEAACEARFTEDLLGFLSRG